MLELDTERLLEGTHHELGHSWSQLVPLILQKFYKKIGKPWIWLATPNSYPISSSDVIALQVAVYNADDHKELSKNLVQVNSSIVCSDQSDVMNGFNGTAAAIHEAEEQCLIASVKDRFQSFLLCLTEH